MSVELLPRFKGIATRYRKPYPYQRQSVELLPRFKGIATNGEQVKKDREKVELLPRFKGIATWPISIFWPLKFC